jgi:hypothetical protein
MPPTERDTQTETEEILKLMDEAFRPCTIAITCTWCGGDQETCECYRDEADYDS